MSYFGNIEIGPLAGDERAAVPVNSAETRMRRGVEPRSLGEAVAELGSHAPLIPCRRIANLPSDMDRRRLAKIPYAYRRIDPIVLMIFEGTVS